MRVRRALFLVAAACGALLVALVAPAYGAGSATQIRQIDSSDPGDVRIDYVSTGDNASSAKVTINGKELATSSSGELNLTKARASIVIVVGTGSNMATGQALVSTRAGLNSLIQSFDNSGVEIAIIDAGESANFQQTFTTDTAKLLSAVERLGPSRDGKSATWKAIRQAAALYSDPNHNELQPNILVVTGDGDTVNPEQQAQARGEVVSAGAMVFGIEYLGNGYDPVGINTIVAQSGGFTYPTSDAGKMQEQVESAGKTIKSQQYQVGVDSGLKTNQIADVVVTAGGSSAKASVTIGGSVRGQSSLDPKTSSSSGGIAFLQNGVGLMLAVGLGFVAVAGIVYALTLLVLPDDGLSAVLQPYADGYVADEDDDQASSLSRSAIIQRAVELTEQVAESQGYLARTEGALERANLPLRAGEALFFYLGFVLVMTLLFLILSKSVVVGLVIGIIAALIPAGAVSFMASRRKKKFMSLLPDTLQLLSGTLRAGYSLMQGVEAVSQEVADPMGIELRRVITESRLGRPLEESLEGTAERMNSPDFGWAVMAIRIQREVGGNLSELLLTVAETMTARERLRRDVSALTAEGRVSAIVLGLMPFGLGVAMYVINPSYTGVLFTDTLGIVLLILGGVGMLAGFFWMKKIIDIEI